MDSAKNHELRYHKLQRRTLKYYKFIYCFSMLNVSLARLNELHV